MSIPETMQSFDLFGFGGTEVVKPASMAAPSGDRELLIKVAGGGDAEYCVAP